MAHINFLEPPKFSLSQFNLKQFELNYFWLMIIAGSLLLFMLTYGIVQRVRIAALNEALSVATAEAQKARGTATGKTSASTLMAALQARVAWSSLINAVANATPNAVALNYIKGVAPARSVQLEGISADVASAAEYEQALAKIPFFGKVLLQSTTATTTEMGAKKAGEKPAEKKPEPAATASTAPEPEGVRFEIQGWLK